MARLRFKAVIQIVGVNPYVSVSSDQASQLQKGWRGPIPVLVQINGQPVKPWRINMMPRGDGSFYLYLHSDVRKASSTKVGDQVKVNLSFDNAYKSGPMPMPAWFEEPLSQNPTANDNWDKLTPSRQKEILRYLVALKSDEARLRNVEKVLHMLSGNAGHYMGRDWKDGR